MNTNDLNNLIKKTIKDMEVKGYKEKTIENERFTFNQLMKYCNEKDITSYNLEVGLKFLEEHYNLSKIKSKRSKCRRLRSIYLLEWINNDKDITKMVIPKKKLYNTPDSFINIIGEYKEYLISKNYATNTVYHKIATLNALFNYSIKMQINNYQNITKGVIYDFIDEIKKNYSNSSLYVKKYDIKTFYDYLYNCGKSHISGQTIFPKIIKKEREKIISSYTKDEISKVLSLVDTNTKIGKRDYAVLLLAITYGLRNSDIINLTFDDIDWNHNNISIIQYKTKEKLNISLTEQVKLSLVDYIKNARPNIKSNNIFLKFKFPYEYNGNQQLYKCFKKYLIDANIDISNRKCGLHSLRHSCATNLLSNNVQLSVITSILGHSSIETTNKYLSVGLEQLKKLSLEVPYNE